MAKEFDVTITETLKMKVRVEAENEEEAQQLVNDGWYRGDYILDADNFAGVEFESAEPVRELSYREMSDVFCRVNRPLESIKDNYAKYVATTDYTLQKRNGIKHINLMEFMKSKSKF